jgi:hypothetical protein
MPISSKFEVFPGYLLVTNSGSNDTLAESMAYVDLVLGECKRLERVGVLIDDRAAAHRIPTVDALAVAEHLQEALGAKHVTRMAVVPGQESLLATGDFAVFMRARGMGFKLFKDLEAARAWMLKSEPTA